MKILFDKYGAQIVAQEKSKTRLTMLFSAITDAGWNFDIAPGALTAKLLENYDVLVLTTRMDIAYPAETIEAIYNFVQKQGGGLWCMGNHAPFNSTQLNNNHLRYVSAISSTFFTGYQPAAYSATSANTPVPLEGDNLGAHEIITGNSNWPLYNDNKTSAIKKVVTRSFCGIYPNAFFDKISGLDGLSNVENTQDKLPVTKGVLWALASKEGKLTGYGRVVIGADSGFIANIDSVFPGPGEFSNGDNPQFCLNTLAWLARLS